MLWILAVLTALTLAVVGLSFFPQGRHDLSLVNWEPPPPLPPLIPTKGKKAPPPPREVPRRTSLVDEPPVPAMPGGVRTFVLRRVPSKAPGVKEIRMRLTGGGWVVLDHTAHAVRRIKEATEAGEFLTGYDDVVSAYVHADPCTVDDEVRLFPTLTLLLHDESGLRFRAEHSAYVGDDRKDLPAAMRSALDREMTAFYEVAIACDLPCAWASRAGEASGGT